MERRTTTIHSSASPTSLMSIWAPIDCSGLPAREPYAPQHLWEEEEDGEEEDEEQKEEDASGDQKEELMETRKRRIKKTARI